MTSEKDTTGKRREAIEGMKMLPAMPFVLSKIMLCINDPRSSAPDLEDAILKDQAITAKILSLANSAAYGQAKKVTSVTQAVVVVGFDSVYQTAAAAAVANALAGNLSCQELNLFDFWKYSVGCAEAAKHLAEACNYPMSQQAYMVGLLHDMGKLVILRLFKSEYEDVLFLARAEVASLHAKEMETFEFDHTDAGRWLAQKWALPDAMTGAISFHHMPDRAPEEYRTECALCAAAEYATLSAGCGANGDITDPVRPESSLAALGMSVPTLQAGVEHVKQHIKEIEASAEALIEETKDQQP